MATVNLTKFEAKWLREVIGTCHDIAHDTLPMMETVAPAEVQQDTWEAWETIVNKVAAVAD